MDILVIGMQVVCLVFSVILHEVAHGYVAYRLGDPTAFRANRLTLNPLPHVDLFGSILLPLLLVMTHSSVLLGWAKPVPVNPGYFRNPRRGMMLVGAAGPLTNLALAVAGGVASRLLIPYAPLVSFFLAYLCITNLMLAVFNLIPIPPLDGSRIVLGFLSDEMAQTYLQLERWGFIIIFGLLYLGALDYVVNPATSFLRDLILGGAA